MYDWQDDSPAEATESNSPLAVSFGHRPLWIDNLRVSAHDCPACLDNWGHDCVSCPFFAPSTCPLLHVPFYLQNLETILVRSVTGRNKATLSRRALRAALQIELHTHGRPLHYTVLARMIADRYPNLKVSAGRISYILSRSSRVFERISPGVYRINRSNGVGNPDLNKLLAVVNSVGDKTHQQPSDTDSDLEWGSPTSLLRVFRSEAQQVDLLNAQQEVELATAISQGTKARRRLRSHCDPAEVAGLHAVVQEGDRARRRLIEANLRLVLHYASHYLDRGLELLDLVQAGCIGLMKAATKFDHRLGNRFSTYATYWVQQAMHRAVANESRLVRLPVHAFNYVETLSRTAEAMEAELGREPTYLELAIATGELSDRARRELEAAKAEGRLVPRRLQRVVRKATARIKRYARCANRPLSLDSSLDQDLLASEPSLLELLDPDDLARCQEQDITLGEIVSEMLSDDMGCDPFANLAREALRESLDEELGTLKEREKQVLELRFGLNDGAPRTLREIGTMLGVTRERVRQIEHNALLHLKNPMTLYRLQEHL